MPKPLPTPLFDTLQNLSQHQSNLGTDHDFAMSDYQLVYDFLRQYDGNQATFNSYRRETERLLHWCWLIKNKSVLHMHRQDVEDYIAFCQSPPKSWIGTKKLARFKTASGHRIANTEWRPFVATVSKEDNKNGIEPNKENYTLSQKATKEIFVIVGSFFNFLINENVTEFNPVATIKQKSKFLRKSQTGPKIPRLSEHQWQTLIQTAKDMAEADPDNHERTLFIVSALYLMYLRISELVATPRWEPMMNHFYHDSQDRWWFVTVGKGNKERHISVSDAMISALKRWREFLGLFPSLPTAQDQSPLIPLLRGKGGVTSTRWINKIVQDCFDKAVNNLRSQKQFDEAEHLATATVHWLRHTGISDDINKRNRPIAHVRDDAGHSNIVTTDRYNDITLKERHESGKDKKITEK